MTRKPHQIGGVILAELSLIPYYSFFMKNWIMIIPAIIVAYFVGKTASMIPDLIEPAKWHHRKFFHSWTVLLILSLALTVLYALYSQELNFISNCNVCFWTTVIVSYISHLLFDAITPMGIPFFK